MKLWKISQDDNDGYDTYDSAIVCAETEDDARHMHPSKGPRKPASQWKEYSDWASSPDLVKVELLGEASPVYVKPCVILTSFNAG